MNVLLANDAGVLYWQGEAQHDQVRISTIEAMRILREELLLVRPDELHDLVFSLSWGIRACEKNREALPIIVLFDLLLQEKVQHFIKLLHESSSGRNGIVFEIFLAIGQISVPVELLQIFFIISGAPEPPRALIVHLASWGNSIEGEYDALSGLEDVHNKIDIIEHLDPDLLKLLRHELCFENDGVVLNG